MAVDEKFLRYFKTRLLINAFSRVYSYYCLRVWRNWQTRQVEGLMGVYPVEVRVLSPALTSETELILEKTARFFLFLVFLPFLVALSILSTIYCGRRYNMVLRRFVCIWRNSRYIIYEYAPIRTPRKKMTEIGIINNWSERIIFLASVVLLSCVLIPCVQASASDTSNFYFGTTPLRAHDLTSRHYDVVYYASLPW